MLGKRWNKCVLTLLLECYLLIAQLRLGFSSILVQDFLFLGSPFHPLRSRERALGTLKWNPPLHTWWTSAKDAGCVCLRPANFA
jgi:hypothetical protein